MTACLRSTIEIQKGLPSICEFNESTVWKRSRRGNAWNTRAIEVSAIRLNQIKRNNRICPMDFLFRARGIRCGCVFCWIVSRRFFSQNPQFFLKTVVKLLPAHNIDFPVFQRIVGPEFRVAVRRQAPIDAIETLFRHQQRTNAFVLTRQAPMTYAVVEFAPTSRTRNTSK